MVSRSRADAEEAVRLIESYCGRLPSSCIEVRQGRARHGAVFRSGTLERIKGELALLEKQGIGSPARLYVNETLKPLQERNLSRAIGGREVMDRTTLVLEIFSQRARTKEAKLQTELASLVHQQSRLVRPPSLRKQIMDDTSGLSDLKTIEVEVVSGRQRGGTGGSAGGGGGQGEQELADQRYRIKRKIHQLRLALDDVRRSREQQRKGRVLSGTPSVALVGYTNAGKSSLLSLISNDDEIEIKDALFVTLDPLKRRVTLPTSNETVIASDTVGFIQDLPVSLIDAFRATLEEVTEADLIVHVIDAANTRHKAHRKTVIKVLCDLGVPQFKLQNAIEVWNKCDQLVDDNESAPSTSSIKLPHGGIDNTHSYDPKTMAPAARKSSMGSVVLRWKVLPLSLSWVRFSRLYDVKPLKFRFTVLKRVMDSPPPPPDWMDGGSTSISVEVNPSSVEMRRNTALKPSRPLFSQHDDSRRKLHTMTEDAMSSILALIQARVKEAHVRCQYKPLAIACSAKMGWGVDTLLLAIEKKLKTMGKLRG